MLAFPDAPFFEVDGKQVPNSKTRELPLVEYVPLSAAICVIASSLFYWFWTVYSNCFDFTNKDFARFPIELEKLNLYAEDFETLYRKIELDLKKHARLVSYNKAKGVTRYYEFKARHSKYLFDEVDNILADYYGFNDDEVEYIKNYDLRFRTDER